MNLETTLMRGRQLIDGSWCDARDEEMGVLDPATGETIGVVPCGSAADVDDAVAAARRAQPAWGAMRSSQRGEILVAAAEVLASRLDEWSRLVTREMGKPLAEARAECERAIRILHYYAGEARRPTGTQYESEASASWILTRHSPLGVVALITPWNFPAAIPAWKAAPAIAFGNTVVLKLAEDTPLSGLVFAEALQAAGLPAGVLNVLLGDGPSVGAPLSAHRGVDAISFTGSTATGAKIREASLHSGARVQLEMGGHSPAIVRADADAELTVEALFQGAFASTGQKCTATRRIYIHRSRFDEILAALIARTADATIGSGLEPSVEVGPMINQRQLDGVQAALARIDGGARVEYGGERLTDDAYASGCFMRPAIVTGVHPDAELASTEVFGPVVSVWSYDADEEALAAANDTPYGLSAGIFTRDLDAAMTFADRIRAGVVRINQQTAGMEFHVPFGGWGDSGYGPREQGRAAFEFFTRANTVYIHPSTDRKAP